MTIYELEKIIERTEKLPHEVKSDLVDYAQKNLPNQTVLSSSYKFDTQEKTGQINSFMPKHDPILYSISPPKKRNANRIYKTS